MPIKYIIVKFLFDKQQSRVLKNKLDDLISTILKHPSEDYRQNSVLKRAIEIVPELMNDQGLTPSELFSHSFIPDTDLWSIYQKGDLLDPFLFSLSPYSESAEIINDFGNQEEDYESVTRFFQHCLKEINISFEVEKRHFTERDTLKFILLPITIPKKETNPISITVLEEEDL